MYKKINTLGKYGIKGLKINETLYFSIDKHDSLRCLCNYYKNTTGLVFKVNKAIDDSGNECIAVTRTKKKKVRNGK